MIVVGRFLDHDRAEPHAAARMSAAADRHPVGVAGHEAHAFDRHAEPFGHQLREARLVALGPARRADHHLDGALGQNRDLGSFRAARRSRCRRSWRRRCRGACRVFSPRRGGAGNPSQSASVKRARHDGGIVAAVVGPCRTDFCTASRLRGHQIAPAKLDAVEAALARGEVDQPLDDEHHLGPAGAAVGAGRRGVAEHGAGAEMRGRHAVDARHDLDALLHHGEAGAVGAEVAEIGAAHGEEIAVARRARAPLRRRDRAPGSR